MAVTNATTQANLVTNGGAVAEVLSSLVLEQLYDPTDLRALCLRVPFDGVGSATTNVTQDMVPGAFAAPGENTTTAATAYTTSHFDITVERYSRAYALTDLIPVAGDAIDLDRVVQNLINGVSLTFTDIICDFFHTPGFANTVGTAGVNLSVDDIYDAIFQLTSSLNAPPYAAVLHPIQFNDWLSSLRGETGAAQFAPATIEMLGQKGVGYKGSWMNTDFYVSDSVDATPGGIYTGAMMAQGALAYAMAPVSRMIGHIPAGNIILDAGDVVVELDRTASDGVTAAYAHMFMGVAEAEDARGVRIVSDA